MNGTKIYYHGIILVLVVYVGVVNSIKCFQCNSAEHPECANLNSNDTDSVYLRECRGNYEGQAPFCRKITYTILDLVKITRLTRSCGWKLNATRKSVCKNGDTDFILEKNCLCFTDACNVSSKLSPASASTLIILVILFSLLICYRY